MMVSLVRFKDKQTKKKKDDTKGLRVGDSFRDGLKAMCDYGISCQEISELELSVRAHTCDSCDTSDSHERICCNKRYIN